MNGIHDCGGMDGLGTIPHVAREPVFTEDWERRVLAMARLAGASGAWAVDTFRHAIERMPPADYLRASYYEKWATSMETMLREGPQANAPASTPAAPRLRVGAHVVTRNINPPGHTRLPRYARAKAGVVARDCGVHAFADSRAHGDAKPQHLYVVRFAARTLWGDDAAAHDTVCIDLWDDHLEPVSVT